ncbi:Cytochrome P450 monooxygenase [Fulvia fulva]|uniref:Cytochrome P450 monooxygenase n=1 Tax=Passalora fulva TaxID=5499 RepID=A0A9Q8PF71_PASFU|nr:Cytochrome P450 monooxygenase [Fulvia fulva]KAK4618728.1 Cytochrome P450 monooxygenase [Fulvia fulva]UJO21307.1 Cytochrome P450 monooxygenase [Fulvia fulva]
MSFHIWTLEQFNPNDILCVAAAAAMIYGIWRVAYNLFFSPLAKIPGPKLAAMTRWVETYYECFNEQGGQFRWAYSKWHDVYGPIIRVAPNEVHVRDSEFYDKLYQHKPQAKADRLNNRFDCKTSIFDTSQHLLHARRRAVLEVFFSRKRISDRSVEMQEHLDRLCQTVRDEYLGTDAILYTDDMWSCWTSDIISGYSFATNDNMIALPRFRSPLREAMNELLEPMHWITQCPILKNILFSLPQWFVLAVYPAARPAVAMKNGILSRIQTIRANVRRLPDGDHAGTIFGTMLTSDLPSSETSDERLKDEGIGLLGVGTETTMRTLSIGLYFLWEQPSVKAKLMAELKGAIPDPNIIPHWDVLAKLPYLAGCVNEAMRLSYGASQRLIRVFDQPITYGQFVIDAGTEIGMDIYDVCHDETIFHQSHEFRPERWLEDVPQDGQESRSQLSRHLVVFGRGPRACIGRHLAHAEACLGLATFVRRFDYEMFETPRAHFAFDRDRLAPRPRKGTPGIRMEVTGVHT